MVPTEEADSLAIIIARPFFVPLLGRNEDIAETDRLLCISIFRIGQPI